jgi:hypothetical protein
MRFLAQGEHRCPVAHAGFEITSTGRAVVRQSHCPRPSTPPSPPWARARTRTREPEAYARPVCSVSTLAHRSRSRCRHPWRGASCLAQCNRAGFGASRESARPVKKRSVCTLSTCSPAGWSRRGTDESGPKSLDSRRIARRYLDPIPKASQFSDHLARSHLLRFGANGRPPSLEVFTPSPSPGVNYPHAAVVTLAVQFARHWRRVYATP